MSLHLEFEPHSWYMGWAIRDNQRTDYPGGRTWTNIQPKRWTGYTADGDTYYIVERDAHTLRELKQQIKEWHAAKARRSRDNRRMIGEEV